MSPQTHPRRFFLYPEPVRGIELLGPVRHFIWRNAGFGSLAGIRNYLATTEPRFDPAVVPVEDIDPHDTVTVGETAESGLLQATQDEPALERYSVGDYRRLYLSGEASPLDVVEAILPLIRRDTSPPGEHSTAWIDVKTELVIDAARNSTARYQEKRPLGPLDGVPVAIKDEYDVEGYATTLGTESKYIGDIEVHDSWCVKKLKDAGAIIMGKVTMVEFGMDTSGSNTSYGTPLNPYNPGYYTGGSSSGSAYAVSAGLVPIALGSDGGGSIRIPSSFCSVIGLKPTHGRLSFAPSLNHSSTCAVKGPIAADVGSLAAVYAAISQPHPSSPFPQTSLPTTGSLSMRLSGRPKIIGVPEDWLQHAAPGVQTLCRGIIKQLAADRGYKVVPIEIPFTKEGRIAHAMTMLTDASTAITDTGMISPTIRILLALGRTTPATDYLLAQKLRHVLMQHLAWLWRENPGMVIVTPTTRCAGWPIRSAAAELRHGISDGDRTQETMEYVWLANFCGVPSISLPAGYVIPEGDMGEGKTAGSDTVGKVPVGIMATGEWASEAELMQFAMDCTEVCTVKERCPRPPAWVDVMKLAKQNAKRDSNY